MAFSNNHKTKIIAAIAADNMDYVKKSKSYLPQSQREGMKYGQSYTVYIPDPGKVVDGLVADPDTINEVEYTVTCENKNTSVELDVWNKLNDIESFTKEVAKPKAQKLARQVQKDVIDKTAFESAQTIVGDANFNTLTNAAAALEEAACAGDFVTFTSPTVHGRIAATGLANYIPDEIQKKIYGKNYLGEYAGCSQIDLSNMPEIKIAGNETLSVTLTSADGGFAPVSTGTVTNIQKNAPFVADGLFLVDVNGIETDIPYVVSVDKDGKFPELRITEQGKAYGNPNAWVAKGTSTLTFTLAAPAGTYSVGVAREADALAWDTYRFTDLPGSENSTETVDGVSIKLSQYGNGEKMTSLARLDMPYATGVPDARRQVTVLFKK